jgi:hypothetical protein
MQLYILLVEMLDEMLKCTVHGQYMGESLPTANRDSLTQISDNQCNQLPYSNHFRDLYESFLV